VFNNTTIKCSIQVQYSIEIPVHIVKREKNVKVSTNSMSEIQACLACLGTRRRTETWLTLARRQAVLLLNTNEAHCAGHILRHATSRDQSGNYDSKKPDGQVLVLYWPNSAEYRRTLDNWRAQKYFAYKEAQECRHGPRDTTSRCICPSSFSLLALSQQCKSSSYDCYLHQSQTITFVN